MAAIHQIKRQITAKELAKKWGVSQQTVRKYFALPREKYEAESATKLQPWANLGVSRATWYRHGKPLEV